MCGFVRITPQVQINLDELRFRYSRSSGPGGQNVNRRETQVELTFDLMNSASLTPDQRQLLMDRLSAHLDSRGTLHIVANSQRSQLMNRREAVQRFESLLREGLKPTPRRLDTQPSRKARLRRLSGKRRRSEIKRQRQSPRIAEHE